MKDRAPEFTPWPDGTIAKPTGNQKRELYYHYLHDTPKHECIACAWEQAI